MFAYLDAGSASVMVSAVAAGVGGAAVAMKGAMAKFKRGGKKTAFTAEEPDVEPEVAPEATDADA